MVKNTIAIDAMGGDNAPKSIIAGLAISAVRNPGVEYLVYGDKNKLIPLLKNRDSLKNIVKIVHVEDWIRADEKASKSLRRAKTTSMGLAIDAVANGEAGAIVSAGNSGALLAMSIFGLRKLSGISRPALAAVMPTISGEIVALDLGANIDCSSQNLIDFSVMGIVFAKNVLGKLNPRLALLNVGEEENKGSTIIKEASSAMERSNLSKYYVGFVEGDKIITGNFDIVVCDGFSGNIMLKTAEGTAKLCSEYLKQIFNSSFLGKISFAIGRSSFLGLRKKLDPRKHNGAVLLGLNGIVVKSHGGADSISFAHAVDLATEMSIGNYNDLIKKELNNLKSMH
ncbi:MAG: Phosphate acyltransferase [Alphaproteobacteria bacterium MarineAlpha9_Bin3]|nr:MAG: Phosphate acyltransferase [Alphaproteobacteria bacterium MarineAlpha9_Bin3]|tara:strand:+ start:188 stop:1207 length:1020 start_codon:yes stop_codon:yes gene_type:complete